MSKLDIYEEPIIDYCREHNIDFDAIKNMDVLWGVDTLEILNSSKQPLLKVSGYNMKDLLFEQTEQLSKYKLNGTRG